jgi:glucose/arabinose dehydrogenase
MMLAGVLAIGVMGLMEPSARAADEPDPERSAHAERIGKYYKIENIPTPEGVAGEVGAMTFMPDGRLAVAFPRHGVYLYEPDSGEWTRFAQGLDVPMGLHAVSEDELLVAQRPELTRLVDADGDGRAEVYETVCDDFGQSGNYHEFNFGPAVDSEGGAYLGLSNASSGAGIRHEVRGRLNPVMRKTEGHYSPVVPYRGWVVRVDPTGALEPIACGFRQPNGVAIDPEGRVFATDNQGGWVGTSKLYHVRRGHFYGHAPSLYWREGFAGDPLDRSLKTLDRMRTRAAVLFPHGTMASSPTKPVWDTTGGAFGPFEGQAFVGEMNQPRIMRVMLEEVA